MPLNVEMGSQKLLQEWCRLQCENYPNVEIKDLTTSFKDGLAFCAIIHKHRPDLLDFQSLSKDRGYENNCLAFEVAETHLGIPAVLDPADMVSVDVPDRLSVITYLSQYFIYFAKPSDAGYSSLLMPGLPNTCKAERKGLLISEAVHLPKVKVTNTSGEEVKDQTNSTAPAHLCNACQQCVHLVQRHLVDGKLYHRSCFRCSQCSSTLFPGSYRTDSETGSLLCSNLCLQKPNGLPKLQGPADPEEGPQEAKTQDVPSASISLVEKHALETTEEEGSENQPPEIKSGQIVRDEQCSKNSEEHNNAKSSPAKQTGEVEIKEKKETLEKEKIIDMDNDTKRSGVSAGTGSSPTLAKKPGTNSRPVPAPRRAKAQPQQPSTSNPPWPPPRARPAKPMDRSKSEDHTNKTTSKPGEESPSLSRSSEQGGESQKPKSAPWMDLIHPGPWNKLPPVPLPRHPSRSTSVPFLSEMWSRQKSVHLSPGNPFDEDDTCEDPQGSHSGTWTACPEGDESRNTQSAVVMTSHPRCCTDEPGQVSDNKTSKADSPQPAQCADTAPARKRESISVKRGAVCSIEASNCLFAKANTQASVVKTEMRAEADGKGNGAQPTCPAGVSDLAETAGSVCLLKLAEEVTVLEASRLDSSAGRSELESLPKSALASLPQTISEADIRQEQDPPACVSELQLPTQQRNPPSRTSSSLSGSFSDLNIKQHSNSTRLLASDGPLTNKKPEVPIKPKFDKRICKENPFNRAASLAEIPSASSTHSTKAAAPGHGFPLIKRKVQSDQYTLGKDLQTERGELNRRLDGLEQKGVELEKSLRDCHNEKEDDLLVNWFTLIHEKHMLVRRDAELVYLAKQQSLEERQSDVEYQLRCLFNKPEKEWSQDDKAKEKQLMEDLVTLIEQRNQIINSLDQDRQREQEEDMLLEDMMKRRDFQRPSGQDQKIFSGKFKPMKILKQLSHKTESKKGKTKTSLKKKS